jgi:hypothetical protein
MPSSWSPSLRFELQFTGENINLWGEKLNSTLARVDHAIAGWLIKPLTGDVALTAANAADDEARAAMVKFTGGDGPFTVTLPAVSKTYLVWNACTGAVTLTVGAGATVSLSPGDIVHVLTDGAEVKTPGYGGSSVKAWVEALAWTYNAGALPGQAGNAGKVLRTDGETAAWAPIAATELSDYATAVRGLAVAMAVAL